jgi:hypothetical protein
MADTEGKIDSPVKEEELSTSCRSALGVGVDRDGERFGCTDPPRLRLHVGCVAQLALGSRAASAATSPRIDCVRLFRRSFAVTDAPPRPNSLVE